MTTQEIIKKIRAEVLRLIRESDGPGSQYGFGKMSACNRILNFLDTIQEQPVCEGLEEEMIAWHKKHFKGKRKWEETSGEYLEHSSQLDLARHFAQWQKEQMMKSPLVSIGNTASEELQRINYENGKKDMREQMLKEAVDAEVKSYVGGDGLYWEDIKAIVTIADDLLPDPRYKHDLESSFQTEESYYQEVLRRYKEGLK